MLSVRDKRNEEKKNKKEKQTRKQVSYHQNRQISYLHSFAICEKLYRTIITPIICAEMDKLLPRKW